MDSGSARSATSWRFNRGTPAVQTALVVRDWSTLATNTTLLLSTADVHLVTLGANITLTLDVNTLPDRTKVRVELTQDATGSRLVTWTNAVWPAATAPTLTTTAAHIDVLEFTFVNSATTWRGLTVSLNYAS